MCNYGLGLGLAGVGQYPLLIIVSPFDETTYTAENHKAFIGDILEWFGKSLPCKKYLQGSEVIIQKIQCLMTTLRQVKQAGKLRTKTALEPVIRNEIRWSSTYEMLKLFIRLQEFIDTTVEALNSNVLTPLETIALKDLMKDLEQFQTTFIRKP